MPQVLHVHQGEYRISADRDVVLSAVLGSCVACCIFDEAKGLGGMNHFLVPTVANSETQARLAGAQSIELLINALMKVGTRKDDMKAKLFGGGDMLGTEAKIGQRNAAFAQEYLKTEMIECVSQSLGGKFARRVRFWPSTGRAMQKALADVVVAEPVKLSAVQPSDVELF